jgi:hypothetical protein
MTKLMAVETFSGITDPRKRTRYVVLMIYINKINTILCAKYNRVPEFKTYILPFRFGVK